MCDRDSQRRVNHSSSSSSSSRTQCPAILIDCSWSFVMVAVVVLIRSMAEDDTPWSMTLLWSSTCHHLTLLESPRWYADSVGYPECHLGPHWCCCRNRYYCYRAPFSMNGTSFLFLSPCTYISYPFFLLLDFSILEY